MSSYFERLDATAFRPTDAVRGFWTTEQQHIAAGMGLLVHEIEQHHAADGGTLQLGSVAFDIFGVLPIEPVAVAVRVIRPGRTIQLVEAALSHGDRPALIARAWLLQRTDTGAFEGTSFSPIPPRDEATVVEPSTSPARSFVESIEARRHQDSPGRGSSWLRADVPLLDSERVSLTARMFAIIDVANGMAPRVDTSVLAYPNVDLTAHLVRAPRSEWIGLDTTVAFAADGIGLTHSVLHDEHGPLGTSAQTLTLRPR